MRFNYKNRSQSEGRVKDIGCGKPMLGIGEDDPRKWHPSSFFDDTFCDCPEKAQEKSMAMSDEDKILNIIFEWQKHWMLNEPGYAQRAMMIDANMRHHLAKLISDACSQERSRREKLRAALKKIADPRLRDHKEPDAYTSLGCVMNIANEALAADDEEGKIMTKNEEILMDAIKDIERICVSLAQLKAMSFDKECKVYKDSFVVVARITQSVQQKISLQ